MGTYIANFGSGNWAWPECRERNIIATMDDVRVGAFWVSGDLEEYVRESLRLLKNRHGKPLKRSTVTHWYNQVTWLHESSGDLWLHSDTKHLWWTLSLPEPATAELRDEPDPSFGSQKINFYSKPCLPWSSKDKRGCELLWAALHPRAKMFLMDQGTFQPVLNQNAAFVMALVEGTDLSAWYDLREWQAKAEKSGKGAVRSFSAEEIAAANISERMRQTAARMIETAQLTALQSGQEIIAATKDKHFRFASDKDAQEYTMELMREQKGRCALTSLPLLLDDETGDDQLRYSLDRIDSSGHYERGNLQVVCKFINKWKGAMANEEFKRLIAMIGASR